METCKLIAEQHARKSRVLADPLLKCPFALLASIVLLNGSNIAVLGVDAIACVSTVLIGFEILAEAADFDAARAVAHLQGLEYVGGEARREGRIDRVVAGWAVTSGKAKTRFDRASVAARGGCAGGAVAGAIAVKDHARATVFHERDDVFVEAVWSSGAYGRRAGWLGEWEGGRARRHRCIEVWEWSGARDGDDTTLALTQGSARIAR